MPKIPKIETAQELYLHIDNYCADKGLDIDHKDFISLMKAGASGKDVQRLFDSHYVTARKWVKVYKNNEGVVSG